MWRQLDLSCNLRVVDRTQDWLEGRVIHLVADGDALNLQMTIKLANTTSACWECKGDSGMTKCSDHLCGSRDCETHHCACVTASILMQIPGLPFAAMCRHNGW